MEFHGGSNGIVGPNGCGKSNVVDAVRWVIGEQNPRMLRAETSEDLISDGTVSLKPVGMAEVTMVLSGVPGRGFDDVSITRRVYRDGGSEYSINGVSCRLKDIAEIFMDTGAGARSNSIIGQGEVEGFIMAKPEEKRRLIEEVAGIVKYRARRKETRSRLRQTEENLEKVKSLSKEAHKHKENLKRQAEQAQKLNELSERASRLELLMLGAQKEQSSVKLEEVRARKSEIENSARDIELEKSSLAAGLRSLEREAQGLESAAASADSEILAAREKISGAVSSKDLFAGRKTDIEGLLDMFESEKLSLERQTREIKEKISNIRSEDESAGVNISELRAELDGVESELESVREVTRVDKDGIEEVRNSFFSTVEQCDSTEASYRELTAEIERLSARSGYLSEHKDSLLEEKNSLSSQRENFLSQIKSIRGAQENSEKERKDLGSGLGSFSDEHKKLLDKISLLKDRRSRSASRLEELVNIRESFEWLPESSRSLLFEGGAGGVLGVLSDYASVPPRYAKAFEAALGERVGWILVGTGGDASDAIGRLRGSSAGRATFMPLDSVSAQKAFSAPDGARPISDVVRLKGRGAEVLRKILEGIYVVDTLEDAFECASSCPELSFATLEGDFLDSSGAVSGGGTTGGVFERQSEIEMLTAEVAELDEKIKSSLEKSGNFEVRIEEFRSKISALDELIQTDRVKLDSLERDLESFNFSIEGKESKLAELEAEITRESHSFQEKTARLNECREKLEALRERRENLKNSLAGLEEKNSEVDSRESALAGRLGSLKIEIASLERGRENSSHAIEGLVVRENEISARVEEISAETAEKIEEKSELENSYQETRQSIDALEADLEKRREGVEKIREGRTAVLLKIRDLREQIEGLDERIEETRSKRGEFEISLGTIENNMEYVSEKINEVLEKSGAEMPPAEEISIVNIEDTKAAFTDLRAKIDRFGLVNLFAPEEYEREEKEHDFLETQIEDLEKSAASLKKSISRLDGESAEKFTEAFEEVDLKFRELLPTLFKGGEGRLVMTNPDDPVETGIDIFVKPGGKKSQNMSLLSGGEKALSAIAFIISACLVRPLPFIILDEIDAPLDDSNTGRFASLIKEISRNSQTLVVTHNKTTISGMDALIGITASKAANSAVVSVDLAKAV